MGWSCALKEGSNSSVTIQASLLGGVGVGVEWVCPLLAVPLL